MALKAKAVSVDWGRVESIFKRTLFSVCNQTDNNYQVIVVCNEIPSLARPVPDRVRFVIRDIPPPQANSGQANMKDKFVKLQHGLIVAKDYMPNFIMIMDADDLVSRRLAELAAQEKNANGWIFANGYRWQENSRWLHATTNFHRFCGTSAIVNASLIDFPSEVTEEQFRKCIVLANGHTIIADALERCNRPLSPLPFPGAIYVLDHGENDSSLRHVGKPQEWHGFRHFWGSFRQGRYFSERLKSEFGIHQACDRVRLLKS
jgi:hypothetical protein